MPTVHRDAFESDPLLRDFVSSTDDLLTLADKHGLSIAQLLDWWDSSKTQEAIRALESIADSRLSLFGRLYSDPEVAAAPGAAPRESDVAPIESAEPVRHVASLRRRAAPNPARHQARRRL